MKRKNMQMRKMAFTVVSCVAACLVWNSPVLTSEVNAVTSQPGLSGYATPEQLMTKFNMNDTSSVQRVIFGKNGYGEELEWYIAGKDEGVSGDNIVLLSATPLKYTYAFGGITEKTYDEDWECHYTSAYTPTTVYGNHYGGSAIRSSLKEIATDTNYFSQSEQEVMNSTTIATIDTKNRRNYTVTDKLYIPSGTKDESHVATTYIGSGDAVEIPVKYLCGTSSYSTWLRSTAGSSVTSVNIYVITNQSAITETAPNNFSLVRPVCNLNLSTVLFASSVNTTDSDKTGMRLRFDGSEKIQSYYFQQDDEVEVYPCNNEKVYLVVQWGSGSYVKAVTGTDTVKVTERDIKEEKNLSQTPDFSNCKIWIEKAEDNLLWAKYQSNSIETVEIKEITAPVVNATLDKTAKCSDAKIKSISEVTYAPADDTAAFYTAYTASITLSPVDDYRFKNTTTVTIDGNLATSTKVNKDGTLTATYVFSKTAKAKLLSITPPASVTGIVNGAAKTAETLKLPEKVAVSVEDDTLTEADVVWDVDSCSYQADIQTEQTFTIDGTVTIPDIYDNNGVSDKVQIIVTVAAKVVEETPEPEKIPEPEKTPEPEKIPEPEKTPEPESEKKDIVLEQPDDKDVKGSTFGMLQARMGKVTKNTIQIKWNKVQGVDGYIVYGNQCNTKAKQYKMKKIVKVKTNSFTQKKLKKGTYYKYIIKGYKMVNGKEEVVAIAKTVHVVTLGGKYSNYVSAKVPKTKVNMKVGEQYTIKAKTTLKKGTKASIHRSIAYESSNKKIATVSSKGVVKAKKKGTCYIYVYAQNGVYKKVKITVK